MSPRFQQEYSFRSDDNPMIKPSNKQCSSSMFSSPNLLQEQYLNSKEQPRTERFEASVEAHTASTLSNDVIEILKHHFPCVDQAIIAEVVHEFERTLQKENDLRYASPTPSTSTAPENGSPGPKHCRLHLGIDQRSERVRVAGVSEIAGRKGLLILFKDYMLSAQLWLDNKASGDGTSKVLSQFIQKLT